jgi:broad specificity phosphatase PhoE
MGTQRATTAEVYLIRHGETEWSRSGQHTGATDLPLTDHGRENATRIGALLRGVDFRLVLTSPLQRAWETCELVGLGARAEVELDLHEWKYGEYEGLRSDEIERANPGWLVFTDGCPGGESPREVAARADRVIARAREGGPVALFGHGHMFRVLVARWIGLPPSHGANFLLDTASLSVLSHYRSIPAVKSWNRTLDGARGTTAGPREPIPARS